MVQAFTRSAFVVGVPLTHEELGVPLVSIASGSQKPKLHAPPLQSELDVHGVQPVGVPVAPGILLR